MRAILTFHSIDDSGSILSYPVRTFTRLMTSIAESGIPVLELDQLWSRHEGVALTFDDGMQSVRSSALPVLRDLGFPAHLFLATGAVGSTNRWPSQPSGAPEMKMLGWDDVEQCVRAGIRIESHTQTHPDLRELMDIQIEEECDAADHEIASRTGRVPRHFAYPYGYHNDRVARIVRRRYALAVTTRMAFLGEHVHDPAKLPRLDTYYMRGAVVSSRPFGMRSRAYLGVRRLLRAIRQGMT